MKNILIFQLAFFAVFAVFSFGVQKAFAQQLTSNGPINFGPVDVGTEEWKTVNLTNTPDGSDINCPTKGQVWVNSVRIGAPFTVDDGCSMKRIPLNDSCSFKVFFKPTEAGVVSGVITLRQVVATNPPECNTAKSLSIDVSGTGKGTEAPTPPPAPPTPPSSGSCPSDYSCKDGCGSGEASSGDTCNFNNQGPDTGTCCKPAPGSQTVSCTENEQPKRTGVCKDESACDTTSHQILRNVDLYTSANPANCGNVAGASDIICCVPSLGDSMKTCSDQGGTCGAAACTGEEVMRSSDCDSEGQHCCKSATSGATCDAANCKEVCGPDEQLNPDCGSVCTGVKKAYCVPKGSTPPPGGGSGPAPEIKVIEFKNPLSLNTVDALLTSILSALRGVIVTLSIIFIVIGAVLYITSAGNEKQSGMAKKAITASMIGLAIGIAAPSFLKEIYKILSANQTLPPDAAAAPSIAVILGNTLSFLLGIVGVLALIMLVVGGAIFLTALGDEKKLDTGKKIFKFALLGIIVALAALVITGQIADFFAP